MSTRPTRKVQEQFLHDRFLNGLDELDIWSKYKLLDSVIIDKDIIESFTQETIHEIALFAGNKDFVTSRIKSFQQFYRRFGERYSSKDSLKDKVIQGFAQCTTAYNHYTLPKKLKEYISYIKVLHSDKVSNEKKEEALTSVQVILKEFKRDYDITLDDIDFNNKIPSPVKIKKNYLQLKSSFPNIYK